MVWHKRDDQSYGHPKVTRLSHAAYRLWSEGMVYAAKHLTDGHLSQRDIDQICALNGINGRAKTAAKSSLLESIPGFKDALWKSNGDGIEIHDFLKFHPSRAQVEKERALARERQRKARERWKDKSRKKSRRDSGVTGGVSHNAPTRPDPPIKGEGRGTASGGQGPAALPPASESKAKYDSDPAWREKYRREMARKKANK